MANENKKPVNDANKTDRRRLGYLKVRFKEVRDEMQAIKNETTELKKKLGMTGKPEGKGKGGAADDDED